jgi:hypothetical protein
VNAGAAFVAQGGSADERCGFRQYRMRADLVEASLRMVRLSLPDERVTSGQSHCAGSSESGRVDHFAARFSELWLVELRRNSVARKKSPMPVMLDNFAAEFPATGDHFGFVASALPNERSCDCLD